MLVHTPSEQLAGTRSHVLVQPPDLYHTLSGWFGATAKGGQFGQDLVQLGAERIPPVRDRACSVGNAETALRTVEGGDEAGQSGHAHPARRAASRERR